MEKSNVRRRKRKALLVVPLVVIPFLTLAFWALGGGKGEAAVQGNASSLNLQLPNAQLKSDAAENKMSFYDQAEMDSVKVHEGQRADRFSLTLSPVDTTVNKALSRVDPPYSFLQGTDKDPNEEKVYQKLAQLNKQLHNSATSNDGKASVSNKEPVGENSSFESDAAERLKRMKQNTVRDDSNSDDTEMNNINQMMEKVLDIQHPERISERIKKASAVDGKASFSIKSSNGQASVSLLDAAPRKEAIDKGFYSQSSPGESSASSDIEAAVHESQTLVDGAVIKLRLLQEITVNGTVIPKDVFVFGIASLNGERLEVMINSVRYKNSLLAVKLMAYDMDGLPGIYIPGAITRDVAKSSVDNAAQMLEITSLDPSLKAQATGAGLSAVKSLLSKKTKLVRVTVKAGYKVLLKDSSLN